MRMETLRPVKRHKIEIADQVIYFGSEGESGSSYDMEQKEREKEQRQSKVL